MELPEILFLIFKKCKPADIWHSRLVCRKWLGLIDNNKRDFLQRAEMFIYLCKTEPRFHRLFNSRVLDFLKTVRFHAILSAAVIQRKYPDEIARDLFIYIPNPYLNNRYLSRQATRIVTINLAQVWQPFFGSMGEVFRTSCRLSLRDDAIRALYWSGYAYNPENTQILGFSDPIPEDIYTQTMLLCNIIWIFLLINIKFTPKVLEAKFPYHGFY